MSQKMKDTKTRESQTGTRFEERKYSDDLSQSGDIEIPAKMTTPLVKTKKASKTQLKTFEPPK